MTVSPQERPDYGRLEAGPTVDGVTSVFFVPTEEAAAAAGVSHPHPAKMLEIDANESILWIYPLVTRPEPGDFLTRKFPQIERLGFEVESEDDDWLAEANFDMLLDWLPKGVSSDYMFGLGLPRRNWPLIQVIEGGTRCNEILFSRSQPSHVEGQRFVLAISDYESIRVEFARIEARGHGAVLRVKRWQVSTRLAPAFETEPQPLSRGRLEDSKFITDSAANEGPLSHEDQELVTRLALQMAREVATTSPDVATQLRSDLDLVALETLLAAFESSLKSGKGEPYWQKFFERNPFALHLAFGIPVLTVHDQASVGGRKLSGEGEKIVDYFVKNALTDNVGLFEIKRPDERLLRRTPYRGGVYGPSKALADAVTQVLDQRYQLSKSLVHLKDTSGQFDLESFSIRCCLVIGRTPLDRDERKSLELFRNDLKSVEVVTYDELFVKLRQLEALLRFKGGD